MKIFSEELVASTAQELHVADLSMATIGEVLLVAQHLEKKTGIPFHIAEDPLRAVVRGTNIALKNINHFSFLMR